MLQWSAYMNTFGGDTKKKLDRVHPHLFGLSIAAGTCAAIFLAFLGLEYSARAVYEGEPTENVLSEHESTKIQKEAKIRPLDTARFDALLLANANVPAPASGATVTPAKWPVKTDYPLAGAILPFHRIIAYYGNFYSTKMGVLGEYSKPVMLGKLDAEIRKWQAADPTTPVIPGIHYIAVTAQGSPGADGKYRFRMPDEEIMKAVELAREIKGIAFLDIQPGLSTVQSEIPYFDKYMAMPDVHLGIDPEFAMTRKGSKKPGTVIGTLDAADINYVTEHLAAIVRDNNLPPKILVIHRFTQGMVTNYESIVRRPEVQIIVEMDGWGHQANKLAAYSAYVTNEPIQFTGFKLFYKNDIKGGAVMLSPEQLLELSPKPLYIQFQ